MPSITTKSPGLMSYGLYLPLAKALNISTIFYSHKIADALGSEKCKALFFLHAFS